MCTWRLCANHYVSVTHVYRLYLQHAILFVDLMSRIYHFVDQGYMS